MTFRSNFLECKFCLMTELSLCRIRVVPMQLMVHTKCHHLYSASGTLDHPLICLEALALISYVNPCGVSGEVR